MVFDGRPVVYKTTVTFEMVVEIIKTKGYDPETIQDFLSDDSGKSDLIRIWNLAEPVEWRVYPYQLDDLVKLARIRELRENSISLADLMGINTPVLNEGCRRVKHGGVDRSGEEDTTGDEEHYEKGGDD